MLLIGQTKLVINGIDEQLFGVQFHHGTVLERVIQSDTRREQALRELGGAPISRLKTALGHCFTDSRLFRSFRSIR
jgi:hypothetical protein